MKKPPKILTHFLSLFLNGDNSEEILGDFEEKYNVIRESKGVFVAWIWYLFQVLISFPRYIKINITWSIILFKNYLKITIRTLLKNKVFSIINITGIALSIAICLMIIIYIRDWRSADRFQTNKDRIFRVYTTDSKISWDMDGWATTPAYLAPYLLQNYADIEDAVRLRRMGLSVLFNKTAIYIGGYYAEL